MYFPRVIEYSKLVKAPNEYLFRTLFSYPDDWAAPKCLWNSFPCAFSFVCFTVSCLVIISIWFQYNHQGHSFSKHGYVFFALYSWAVGTIAFVASESSHVLTPQLWSSPLGLCMHGHCVTLLGGGG